MKTIGRILLICAAAALAAPALAAEAPPPRPGPIATPAPDLADQMIRRTAAAKALYERVGQLEDQNLQLEQDRASLEAKLNAALTQVQALRKQIDDAAKAKAEPATPEPTPSPTPTPPPDK